MGNNFKLQQWYVCFGDKIKINKRIKNSFMIGVNFF